MTSYILQLLRDNPELAVFLTLALGNLVGRLRIGPVELGSVAGCLLMGVLVGMAGIDVPPLTRTFFFLLFLFATGYLVGPQFFAGLRREGLKLALFSVVVCMVCAGTALAVALAMGWDAGTGAGLLAGANTSSIILGIASDTLAGMDMDPQQRKLLLDNIPMAYAVTYIFGTAGTAWFMVAIGAKLLDKDVAARCKELEVRMGATAKDHIRTAQERVGYRAYRLTQWPRERGALTVANLEKHLLDQNLAAFVVRVARGGERLHAVPELTLHPDDNVVVMARHEFLPAMERQLGPEIGDRDLLSFPIDTVRVTIMNKELAGRTLGELRLDPRARGLGLRWLKRGGMTMPIVADLAVQMGDQVELIGAQEQMDAAVHWLGYGEGSGLETSITLVAAAIAIGVVVGLLELRLGGVPITLSLSGGVLLLGLIVGWLRERHPRLGQVPPASLWLMQRLGLDLFIAMIGLSSSAGFFIGLRELGLQLFLAGVVVSIVPVCIGLLLGRYVFRFHPAITMGATCGARTEPASLAVVQNALKSDMPALGFTVPYAVANIMFALLAVLMVVWLS
jgi:putative transport protein